MMPHDEEMDPRLSDLLEHLRPVPDREVEKAALGRANYLAEVKALAQAGPSGIPVSETLPQRLKGWINSIRKPSQRKERFSMLTTLTTLVVAVVLLFGGAGATVYAAQDSLPTNFLYPVKTLSENVQMDLASNPESQLELALKFASRRTLEAAKLAVRGEPIPEQVAARSQQEMNYAFQLAAGLEDAAMRQALERIQANVRQQEQTLSQLHTQMPGYMDPVVARVQAQLEEHARLAELGLQAPQTFRQRVKGQMQNGPGAPPATTPEPPGAGGGFGPGPGPYTGTVTCPDCTPALDGSGPGPGPMNRGATSEPGAGNGGPGMGPGSGDCQGTATCTPVQDGSGPGPGPGPMQPSKTAQPNNDSGGNGSGSSTGSPSGTSVQNGSGSGSANTPEPQPGPNPGGGGSGGGNSGGGGMSGGGGAGGGGGKP